MSRILLVAGVLVIVAATLAYAQLPPAEGLDGVPFMKVNINPTNIPPQVNINPFNSIPLVEVTRMPDLAFEPSGCSAGRNFRTAIAQVVAGPFMVTYLNVSPDNAVTLAGGQGGQRVNLAGNAPLTSAIYLAPGQALEFESPVFYSGCVPD